MTTVLILLDAFRWDYLSPRRTPFLWRAAREGLHIARVVPSPGFCERAEMLTGRDSRATGYLMALGFAPERSPYRRVPCLRTVEAAEALLPWSRARRVWRYRMAARLRRWTSGMHPYCIPASFLRYFALTEDAVDHRSPGGLGHPSLLDEMSRRGRRYFYDSFTSLQMVESSSDTDRLRLVVEAIERNGFDLYLVYISAPDAVGHCHGPESEVCAQEIRRLDGTLESFCEAIKGAHPPTRFLFVGDHGMTQVRTWVDLHSRVVRFAAAEGLRVHRDYLYFLDSTWCRLWAFNDRAKNLLATFVDHDEAFQRHGIRIDPETAAKYRIPWPNRLYGDILWWAQEGVLVSPDFFHGRDAPRGMHGYRADSPDSHGTCILWGPGQPPERRERAPLSVVHDLVADSVFCG